MAAHAAAQLHALTDPTAGPDSTPANACARAGIAASRHVPECICCVHMLATPQPRAAANSYPTTRGHSPPYNGAPPDPFSPAAHTAAHTLPAAATAGAGPLSSRVPTPLHNPICCVPQPQRRTPTPHPDARLNPPSTHTHVRPILLPLLAANSLTFSGCTVWLYFPCQHTCGQHVSTHTCGRRVPAGRRVPLLHLPRPLRPRPGGTPLHPAHPALQTGRPAHSPAHLLLLLSWQRCWTASA
jgi:hypothetical protein